MGQDMGDVASMFVGTMMVAEGSSAATGGTLVTVGSGGVLGEVGIPVAAAGVAVAAEGAILGVSGAASFGAQKGRLNAEGKKEHGNKLNDKPAEGYTLKDKKTSETKKYGETTRGEDKFGQGNQKRYSKKELKRKELNIKKRSAALKRKCTNGSIKRSLSLKT